MCQIVNVIDVHGKRGAFRQGNAIGAIGIAKKSYGDATHICHDNTVVRLLLCAAGAHMGQARLVQYIQRPPHSRPAFIQTVIVGGEHQIKAHFLQVIGQIIRRVEGGIPRVTGAAGHSGLEVRHGVIRPLDPGAGSLHHPLEIVALPLRVPSVVCQGEVRHHITAHRQGGHRRRGPLRPQHTGRRLRLHRGDGGCDGGLPAAGKQ